MLNIYKYELFTTLCTVGGSNLAGIYEYLTSSRGSCCKSESIVIVISGNWEYETGLIRRMLRLHLSRALTIYHSAESLNQLEPTRITLMSASRTV